MSRLFFRFLVLSFACGGSQTSDIESTDSMERVQNKSRKSASLSDMLHEAMRADDSGDHDTAEKLYLRVLARDSDNPTANLRFTYFLLNRGDNEGALEIAEAYRRMAPDDREGTRMYSDALVAVGQLPEAASALNRLIASDDQDAVSYEKRGLVRLRQRDERSLDDLKQAVELAPEEPAFRNSYARALAKFNKTKAANRQISRSLKLDPDFADTWIDKGIVERSQKKLSAAALSHEKAVALSENDARAYYELGVTLNAQGKNTASEESIGRAIDLSPENQSYWSAYADILRLNKAIGDASIAYERALELDPDDSRLKMRYASVLIELGERERAESMIEEILSDDPGNSRARALQRKLSR